MAEKKLLWLTGEKNPYTNQYEGAYFDVEETYAAVNTYNYPIRVWVDVLGEKAKEFSIPEKIKWDDEEFDSFKDLLRYDYDETGKYLDSLVGSEGKYVVDEMYGPISNYLVFDYENQEFDNLKDWNTFKCYDYTSNCKIETITLDTDNQYNYNEEIEIEVLDSYTLDIWDGSNHYYPKGSTGNYAILEKVLADGKPAFLWHEWSQWQGSELDTACIMTVEDILERLCSLDAYGGKLEHPEVEEITEWLKKENEENK
jgi:hypothetical protein